MVNAQDTDNDSESISLSVPKMAVLYLYGNGPKLTLPAPNAAGQAVNGVDANASWLNYISIVGPGEKNKITVAIANDNVPQSTFLLVKVYDAVAESGDAGTPVTTGFLPLSTATQDLITGIGSCHTGSGEGSGHLLKYRWQVNKTEYEHLVAAIGSDIEIAYTITADLQ